MTTRTAQHLAVVACLAFAGAAWASDAPVVTNAWARATPPGTTVGAAYMTIQGGKQADRLVDARSDRAAMVHLHSVEEKDGVSKMRAIEAVEIPAGQRVELAPKSTHVMLMGLDGPLVAGQTFVVTLRFAKAGEQPVTVTVKPASATDDQAQHKH
ncbi:MAG: copper chaperone PCu(A)C [Gammaproteobacteria bacterium]|nr:copper chaperone PCu(A)C [Gammaproteobacteria bacterium]